MTSKQQKANKRLLALDVMRGITIAGMILVNNPGSWSHIYAPLEHAEWHGLTPTDLVFPFFMFIMGLSTWFSLKKYDFRPTGAVIWKIIKRTILIYFIGLAIAWFGMTLRGVCNEKTFAEAAFNFSRIRLVGVLPRLALCYGIGSLMALLFKGKSLIYTICTMLVAYTVILFAGNGFEFSDANVISIVDHKLLGENHIYRSTVGGVSLKFDPEGLLSTLPSIAHMLIGFLCAGMIMNVKDNNQRCLRLFLVGTSLTFAGLLLSYGIPINKKIWSPTFVLTTCGLASSLLATLIWVIDIKGWKKWSRFFEVFGVNPLFLFCLSGVAAIILGAIRIPYSATESGMATIHGWLYRALLIPVFGDETFASMIFALCFMLLMWCIGFVLYRRKIYIKV